VLIRRDCRHVEHGTVISTNHLFQRRMRELHKRFDIDTKFAELILERELPIEAQGADSRVVYEEIDGCGSILESVDDRFTLRRVGKIDLNDLHFDIQVRCEVAEPISSPRDEDEVRSVSGELPRVLRSQAGGSPCHHCALPSRHVATLAAVIQRAAMKTSKYRVEPGSKVDLSDWDPDDDGDYERAEAEAETEELNLRLEALQEKLYAEGKHKVLVVLQATDTGGKDSTIRKVFEHVNPQGVKVASFGRPTDEELARDYLWRVHQQTPGSGEIVIFNRSHYEDVLVVRVHNLVPEARWKKRYEHINNFEELLVDEGTHIVKIYLHISKEEQRERLQDRLDVPEKNWKFQKGDLAEREHWDDYQDAFTAVLEKTSTKHAPWYVVPGNRKWYRNRVITEILVELLEDLDMEWPVAEEGNEGLIVT
jgi:PPK2 family polyphosphate:nucleotide phosphotransferase